MLANNLGHYGITFLQLPEYIQEQIAYRKSKCPDCFERNACQSCGCSVPGKWFADAACSGKRYPDLMGKDDWEKFKKENNLV